MICVKSLYLIGGPGVGKSTTLRFLLPDRDDLAEDPQPERVANYPLMWVTKFGDVTMLGKLREQFPGTDALSMAVLPQAIEWAAKGSVPSRVLGEGQRLANVDFFRALSLRGDLTIVHLQATPEALAERRAGRVQDETWQRAATTRAANVAKQADAAGLRVYGLDTSNLHPGAAAEVIRSLTRW